MVRLIVQEGKTNRSYKVQRGRLSIGSSAEAKLRLTAANVAPKHAELEITEEGVVLRPAPKAAAPKVNGRPTKGETTLSIGDQVWIGNARITLQDEGEEAHLPDLKPGAVRAKRSSTLGGRRGRSSSGLPPGAIVALSLLAAVAILLGGWKLYESVQADDPDQLLAVAEKMIAARNRGRVEEVLARLPSGLTPAQRERVAAVRAGLAGLRAESADNVANIEGHKFFDGKLARYVRDHLPEGEEVDARKVRYFLELCRDFRARWPRHPEIPWVEKQEADLAHHGTLDSAPTWPQLDWCVKNWTGGSPKRFRDAFRLLKQFEKDCRDDDCTRASELRDKLTAEREAYFAEKKLAAQTELENGNTARAVYWLVELVINIGDESMEDRAAKALLQVKGVEAYLKGLLREDEYRFRQLVREGVVRDFAEANGVI